MSHGPRNLFSSATLSFVLQLFVLSGGLKDHSMTTIQEVQQESKRDTDTASVHSTGPKMTPPKGADEALKIILGGDGPNTELDGAAGKRLLRTIDWHLMPVSRDPDYVFYQSGAFNLVKSVSDASNR